MHPASRGHPTVFNGWGRTGVDDSVVAHRREGEEGMEFERFGSRSQHAMLAMMDSGILMSEADQISPASATGRAQEPSGGGAT